MPSKIPDLLQLAAIGRPAIDDYLQHVVSGGLARYREIIQTGGKTGQSLFSHVLDGVFVLDQLGTLLDVTEDERRCLFAAFTVHDLNKVPPFSDGVRAYNSIVTPENVAAEGAGLGLPDFFPRFSDHLNDIVTLARLHQGHQAAPADGLNRRRAAQYRLPLGRLEQLGALIRAADILSLVHHPDDQRYLDRFLAELNQASPERRYAIVTHRLAENRGLFTNLIHNVTVAEITERFAALPVAYFPEGVVYLVRVTQPLAWGETNLDTLAGAVRAFGHPPAERAWHVHPRCASRDQGRFGRFREWCGDRGYPHDPCQPRPGKALLRGVAGGTRSKPPGRSRGRLPEELSPARGGSPTASRTALGLPDLARRPCSPPAQEAAHQRLDPDL